MNILDKEKKFEERNRGLNALNECFDLRSSQDENEEEESNNSDIIDNRDTRVTQYVEELNRISGAYSAQHNNKEHILYDGSNIIRPMSTLTNRNYTNQYISKTYLQRIL